MRLRIRRRLRLRLRMGLGLRQWLGGCRLRLGLRLRRLCSLGSKVRDLENESEGNLECEGAARATTFLVSSFFVFFFVCSVASAGATCGTSATSVIGAFFCRSVMQLELPLSPL